MDAPDPGLREQWLLLEQAALAAPGPDRADPGAVLATQPRGSAKHAALRERLRALGGDGRGWIGDDFDFDDAWAGPLSGSGQQALADLHAARDDRAAQRLAARADLARWVEAKPATERGGLPAFQATATSHWYGQAQERDVLREALDWLVDRGYVRSGMSGLGKGPMDLSLTPDGQDWVDSGCPPPTAHTPERPGRGYQVTVGSLGDGAVLNVAQGSTHVDQDATTSITPAQRERATSSLDAVEQAARAPLLVGLDSRAAQAVLADAAELRALLAEPQPRPGPVSRLLGRITGQVVDGGANELGQSAVTALGSALGEAGLLGG